MAAMERQREPEEDSRREKRRRDHIQTEQNNGALSLGFDDEGKMRGKWIDEGEASVQLARTP